MKKNIFLTVFVAAGILFSFNSSAQDTAPREKKSEEIIIRKNGDSVQKMTIEIDGDKVTVNGKPLSEYQNGDVTIIERKRHDRGSDNFLWAPDHQKDMDVELFQNDFKNAAPHAFLGVMSSKEDHGVKITDVVKGSSAEKAGLANGDIITKVDDKSIASPEDLAEAVTAHKPGEEVTIQYLHENEKKETKAKLGASGQRTRTMIFKGEPGMDENNFNFKMPQMPGMDGMPNTFYKFRYQNENRPKLGLKIEDTQKEGGVRVLEVIGGSPAEKAGLKKEDIITGLNGEKINNVNDAMDELGQIRGKESVRIQALRNNKEMNFDVKIPKKLNKAEL